MNCISIHYFALKRKPFLGPAEPHDLFLAGGGPLKPPIFQNNLYFERLVRPAGIEPATLSLKAIC